MRIPGMIRKMDALGRVVIPAALRSSLGVGSGDLVEMFVEGDRLIVSKFSCTCIFCGSSQKLATFMDKPVCKDCIEKLSN